MGPCAGGAVYSPAITDFIFMVKETSHMFITGPDVIKTVTGEEVDFESLGGAMAHNSKSGVAHFAAEDEDACLQDTRYLLSFLPQNNLETAPRVMPTDDPMRMDEELDHVVPDSPNKPYDMRDVIRLVVDDGEFFEVHEHYAKNIVVGFARLDGYAIGVVGNQPAQLAGVLDIDASVEGRALRAHLRRVQHPAADASSTSPASCPAPSQEWGGIIRHGAKLLYAFTEATVPKITVITRKAYGGAYDVMASKHLLRRLQLRVADAPRSRSWAPRARSTSSTAATSRARRRPTQRREKLIDDYKARFANPYTAAERGYVDDVIVPHETRPKVITALETLLTKRDAGAEAQARQHPALTRAATTSGSSKI